MAKGFPLTIVLNPLDPKHYGGWSGGLPACEADAKDMASTAKSQKIMEVVTLLRMLHY
jgi:hypothetical protein